MTEITHRCRTCNGPVEVQLIDISQCRDGQVGSRFAWGRFGTCPCGSTEQPELVVDDTNILLPPLDAEDRAKVDALQRWAAIDWPFAQAQEGEPTWVEGYAGKEGQR